MKVTFKKRFLRDLKGLPTAIRQRVEVLVFEELPEIDNIQQLSGLKKIQGHHTYYRLRVGDYRIGMSIEQDQIILYRVLHRKDIYRNFP